MFSALASFFRPATPDWSLTELETVLAQHRAADIAPKRTPYPWLADAKPLPPRTGRPHLRLVVNN